MNDFNYNEHAVIGELSINSSSGNGHVKVVGYIDNSNYIFLPQSEISNLFLPRGEVFAHQIQRNYKDYDKELVSLYVIPNKKDGEGYDAFVWDYSREVYIEGEKIEKIEETFTDNGEENYSILSKYNLLNREEKTFVISNGKIYKIESSSSSRFIPYCTITDSTAIIVGRYATYYLDGELPHKEGVIDITTDEQLIDWFINKIVKNDWQDIQNGDGNKLLVATKAALTSLKNLDDKIVEIRLKRINALVKSFILTRDNLQSVIDAKWINETVYKSIDAYKEDYIKLIQAENADEINSIKERHLQEIETETTEHRRTLAKIYESKEIAQKKHDSILEELKLDITNKQNELSNLNEVIAEKQNMINELSTQLESISKRKEDIILDFKIVKDVLGIAQKEITQIQDSTDIILNNIALTENRLPIYRGFNRNLEICLKHYGCQANRVKEISTLLATYDVLLLPDMEIVMAIINATGKCRYITTYVNVGWKSFVDLWNNGLMQLIKYCNENPTVIHYFVIRNINLSYLSNYLQPLLDIQAGYTKTFPSTEIRFPENLKILMTRTNDEVIPLTEDSLRYVGCISKSESTIMPVRCKTSKIELSGYIDAALLKEEICNFSEDEIINSNHIQYYINE